MAKKTSRARTVGAVTSAISLLALVVAPISATAQTESMPAGTGPLEPGTYTESALARDITLTVGEGWEIGGESIPGVGVDLVPEPYEYDGAEGYGMVGFTQFVGEVFPDPCPPAETDPVEWAETRTMIDATATSLADHISAHPDMQTTEPEDIEIAGLTGLRFDGTASVSDSCADGAAYLWDIPEFEGWVLLDGHSARYHLLDAGEAVLAIVLEAGPDVDIEALAATAQPVIDSLAISER